MPWYCIHLTPGDDLPERAERLVLCFDALLLAAGCPDGMDLYVGPDATFYLSPTAAYYAPDLCREYDARPCAVPAAGDVVLIEGYEHDRRRLRSG